MGILPGPVKRALEMGVDSVCYMEVTPRFGYNGFKNSKHFLYQATWKYHAHKNLFNLFLEDMSLDCKDFDYIPLGGLAQVR